MMKQQQGKGRGIRNEGKTVEAQEEAMSVKESEIPSGPKVKLTGA